MKLCLVSANYTPDGCRRIICTGNTAHASGTKEMQRNEMCFRWAALQQWSDRLVLALSLRCTCRKPRGCAGNGKCILLSSRLDLVVICKTFCNYLADVRERTSYNATGTDYTVLVGAVMALLYIVFTTNPICRSIQGSISSNRTTDKRASFITLLINNDHYLP